MVNFKENYHFSRFQGGPTFSRGGGGGPIALFPPLDPHLYNNNLSNLSSIKKTAFTDFKEEFVNRIREKENKDSQKGMIFRGMACFGWVDRSAAYQHFFQVGLF